MLVYLDNSATSKQYNEVTKKMMLYMEGELFGNPSSMHGLGISAEKAIKDARGMIAKALEVSDREIFFTSGGTESDNIAIRGACSALKRKGKKIITSKIEHPAVLETCKSMEAAGFQVIYVGVDENGLISVDEIKSLIDDETILISIMNVNNEVGSIQPIREIGAVKRKWEKLYFHSDAVQAFGKLSLKKDMEDVDLMALSGHKIHGPKGIGALYLKKGVRIEPIMTGGGQEGNIRPGTENVSGIVGFGKATQLIHTGLQERQQHLAQLKSYLVHGIREEIQDIKINGPIGTYGIPSILNVSFLGVRGEVLLHTLEQSRIYVSTGSACSSHKKEQSYVLKAMGRTQEEMEGSIRFSFSEFNTIEEMDYVLDKLKSGVSNIRKMIRR